MFIKSIITTTLLFAGISFVQAESVANPHKLRHHKMSQCKLEADQQQLEGDQRSAFIAACMKR
jgi:psiF repeat